MAITIEEMKDALVDNEIDYIKQMVIEDKHDDLVEFVYINSFNDFKSMGNEEIKELYEWTYNIVDSPDLKENQDESF